MKNLSFIFYIFVSLVLGCSSENTNISSDIRNRPVEEQIVYLDTNKLPKSDDTSVKRAAYLLDYLAENTTSSRKEIGDITTGTVEIIKNRYGKEYKHIDILEGGKRVVDAIPTNKRGKKEDFKSVANLIVIEASTR